MAIPEDVRTQAAATLAAALIARPDYVSLAGLTPAKAMDEIVTIYAMVEARLDAYHKIGAAQRMRETIDMLK